MLIFMEHTLEINAQKYFKVSCVKIRVECELYIFFITIVIYIPRTDLYMYLKHREMEV